MPVLLFAWIMAPFLLDAFAPVSILAKSKSDISNLAAQDFSSDLINSRTYLDFMQRMKNLTSSSTNSKSNLNYEPVIVGIAGGSASGKTTFAKAIIDALGPDHVSLIGHDSYYKELSHMSIDERSATNFDHPASLDTSLLIHHINMLKRGHDVHVPIYDFATHSRTGATQLVTPSRIIIVDGILIFAEPELVQLLDMKIFVDTDDDIRLIRRIQRDIDERGRTVSSVIDQYTRTVRPMHQLYVEPSRRGADIIVPASNDGITPNQVALDMCVSRLREIINFYQ